MVNPRNANLDLFDERRAFAPTIIGDATVYFGDCLKVLPEISTVDAVITDPPYEEYTHLFYRRRLLSGGPGLTFSAITEDQRTRLSQWAGERCAGWLLVFCEAEALGVWCAAIEDAGAQWRRAGIWVKPDPTPQFSGDRPSQGFEAIAMAWCGKEGPSKWNGGGKPGVWTVSKTDDGNRGKANEHPTQKPLRLMSELVAQFTQDSDVVLDPFMGSGTTGVACLKLGRKFIGIETNQEYFNLACARLRAANAQQRLFA